MKKREDYSRDSRKVGPFSIRLPKEFMEDIEKRKGLKKAQPIVEYLIQVYNEAFSPILGNPVAERNAPVKIDYHGQGEQTPMDFTRPEKIGGRKKSAKSWAEDHTSIKPAPNGVEVAPKPPPELSGLDLSIWKRENLKK